MALSRSARDSDVPMPRSSPSIIPSAKGLWAIVFALLVPLVWYGNPAVALLAGTALSLTWRTPLAIGGHRWGRVALQSAIFLLGFSLSVGRVAEVSRDSLWLVVAYVLGVLAVGFGLARVLRLERVSALLITAGTAICGGTAIATLAPLAGARADQVGVAIGIVFLLNALALFGFPVIGHALGMSQVQFGMWAGLAIHDTSSVLATAAIYGNEALQVATTVKLGRTLWLIPVALVVSLVFKQSTARVRVPLFIVAFLAASVFASVVSLPAWFGPATGRVSKALLVVALFFIGSEISWATLRLMRGRVLAHALMLWLAAGSAMLVAAMTAF
jgi:uncharacterized integral membrane protein (TIGR00698 family)